MSPTPIAADSATKKASKKKPVRVAAVAPPKKPRAATPKQRVPSGRYTLQVALLKTQAEAQAVVANLKSKYSGAIGGRQPKVDQKVFGNMGTFYRVQVGPYSNTADPKKFCASLAPEGYDCFVVK